MTTLERKIIDFYKWRTYRGLAGDLQTMLTAEYGGKRFDTLFTEGSNWSFKRAKRRLKKKILHYHKKHYKF